MLTIQTIKRVTQRHGLSFDEEACLLVVAESFEGETVREALTDFLNAYEGVSDAVIDAIWNDFEGGLTA